MAADTSGARLKRNAGVVIPAAEWRPTSLPWRSPLCVYSPERQRRQKKTKPKERKKASLISRSTGFKRGPSGIDAVALESATFQTRGKQLGKEKRKQDTAAKRCSSPRLTFAWIEYASGLPLNTGFLPRSCQAGGRHTWEHDEMRSCLIVFRTGG